MRVGVRRSSPGQAVGAHDAARRLAAPSAAGRARFTSTSNRCISRTTSAVSPHQMLLSASRRSHERPDGDRPLGPGTEQAAGRRRASAIAAASGHRCQHEGRRRPSRNGLQLRREALLHLAGGREPPRGIRFERAIDGAARDASGRSGRRSRSLARSRRRAPRAGRRGPRRRRIRARQQVKQQDAEAVEVAPRRRRPAGQHLGREVERRAGERDALRALHARPRRSP